METIWLLTSILANGYVIETLTMDQHTCRKAEMYSALGKPFQVISNMGSIPVQAATCVRFTSSCPYTWQQIALLTTMETN